MSDGEKENEEGRKPRAAGTRPLQFVFTSLSAHYHKREQKSYHPVRIISVEPATMCDNGILAVHMMKM